ncbi:hypothetical protein K9M47_04270 [Candidatus Gracilibacteria bacterium]|nr:hypothetical protein [Candidatus Gracilibacteria bacterium]
MTVLEIVLTVLLVMAVMYSYVQKCRRESSDESAQVVGKRCSHLFVQRNAIAREFLLYVIPAEKVQRVKKGKSDPGLTFMTNGGLSGLVASGLSEQEFAIMAKVDGFLDGKIRREGDRFEIP